MGVIVDTSGLLAAFVADQRLHAECAAILGAARRRVVSPFVLAELDHMAHTIKGVDAELAVLDELASGSYDLTSFSTEDVVAARRVIDRYRDLGVGLTDASLVVLADRIGTDEILTLDERHFRAMVGLTGKPFRLLPADADH